MESASIPARPARPRGEVLRENISKWGLIFLLVLLPAYSGVKDLPRVYNGLGIAIVSTPRGVMSDADAREAHIGGD